MALGDDERVVIVGAGMAGATVAVTLREAGHAGPITMLGDEATPPFGRPPLSKTYLQGKDSLTDWFVRPPGWYRDNEIDVRDDASVSLVDTSARTVTISGNDTVGYERLALCTGGRPRRPHIPGMDLPGVYLLRTVADCDAMRAVAQPGSRAVVVGMGFIGSEVAASLRQLGVSVTAVMSGPIPLNAVLGAEAGAVMATIHADHGVDLVPDDRAIRCEGSRAVERVVTARGAVLDCDFVVVGAGIEPNVRSLAATALGVRNGVLVDAHCRTSVDGVYAAGDVANHLHPLFGRIRVEHYNNAERMGRAVAHAILGETSPYGYIHSFWSDQYEHSLEYVGHAPDWDRFVVRGSLEKRSFLGFYLRGGVLRATVGVNRGGDPELDAQSELRTCQEPISRGAAVPVDVLEDERVDLATRVPSP